MTKVFIGSASTSRPLVGMIAGWLESVGCTPVPWYEDVFSPGHYTLEDLEALVSQVHGAILLFSQDLAIRDDRYVARGNVIFESGFFVGTLGRMRVAMCRDGNPEQLTNVAGITYINVSEGRRHLARTTLETWSQSLGSPLPTDRRARVEVFNSFPLEWFKRKIVSAKRVRILQTFIPGNAHMDQFERHLLAALDNGCEVDVMLCHPRSGACAIRQESLGAGVDVKGAVERTFYRLGLLYSQLRKGGSQGLTLRAHSTLPSLAIYQVDDEILSSPYLNSMLAVDAPQIMTVASSGDYGQRLTRELDDIANHPGTLMVDPGDVEGWLRRC